MHSFASDALAVERHSNKIELQLRDLIQLFNAIDPSPFENKDLNPDVEEFIVSSSEEYPPNANLALRILLEEWPSSEPTELIRSAIHNYFGYRARLNHLRFSRLMKEGRVSLLIGISFLVTCLLCSKFLLGSGQGTWTTIGRESLTIAGWVAMWRPMEIYLYNWWPLRRRGRIYEKLSRIPVEVSQKSKK